MRRRARRICFQKKDINETKWTHGRACIKLPGRIIVTPTNFKEISYLNVEDFSYDFYYRHPHVGTVPSAIAEEYFKCKYLRSRDSTRRLTLFADLESRHLSKIRDCMKYEYDLHVVEHLEEEWDEKKFRRYLEHYSATSQTFDFQRSALVYEAFTPVLIYYCTDSSLIVDYFKTMCMHTIACETLFMGSITNLKFFLHHANEIGFDPWMLLRKFQQQKYSPVLQFCPVEWSLIQGELERLKLLLKYGCPFYVSNYSAMMFNKKIDGRWWNRNRTIPIVMPSSPTSPTSPAPFPTSSFRYSPTFLAHFTVVIYLTASNAVIYGNKAARRFTESIRLFMRSVPESYTCHEDMLAIVGQLAPSISGIVTMSCDWYKAAFPVESGIGRVPRSLMQLSRCTIRQRCPLPEGISKLPIPDYLKTYLSLEW